MVTRSVSAPQLRQLLDDRLPLPGPAYRGLAEALRRVVTDGRLLAGTRLPSERELGAALGLSRTTITAAYARLREEGYLESRRGAGSTVRLPGAAVEPGPLQQGAGDADLVDLTIAAPIAAPGLGAAYERAARAVPAWFAHSGYDAHGIGELREAIAEGYRARGLDTRPEQVVVTSGALGAVGVATRTLLRTGERVLAESPTYPNALAALRSSGARLVAAPLGVQGWELDEMARLVRQASPRAAYLIPDFHNPTGLLMGDEERIRLAALLRRHHVTPVVDETLADIALDSPNTTTPFAALHPGTFSVGGLSKTWWGGVRLGWLRVPDDQVAAALEARLGIDLGAPVLEQLLAVDLLGRNQEALAARLPALREQREVLLAALARELPDFKASRPPGGLALWVHLPEPCAHELARAAEAEGVRIAPGSRFAVEGQLDGYLRLAFAATPERLELGVTQLARAWQRIGSGAGVDDGVGRFIA